MGASNRQLVLYVSFFAILLAVTEVGSYAGLMLGKRWFGNVRRVTTIYEEQTEYILNLTNNRGEARQEVLDPILGWRYRAGYRKGDDFINSQGLRSGRDYHPVPRVGTLRVAAFGDSFVYGNEVGTLDAWPSLIEQACSQVEVLNYGVGGYGVDQAFLRYDAEGMVYNPKVVLIGFVNDDLRRLVNVFRRFIDNQEIPLFKPRFFPVGDELRLLENPFPALSDYAQLAMNPSLVTKIGRHDHWYSPMIYENPLYDLSSTIRLVVTLGTRLQWRYFDPDRIWDGDRLNPTSEAFKLQIALFKKFVESIRNRKALPLVVIFPGKEDIRRAWSGNVVSYEPLTKELARLEIPYHDLIDAFRLTLQEPVDRFFMPGGHYSRKGHTVVAERLLNRLKPSLSNCKTTLP